MAISMQHDDATHMQQPRLRDSAFKVLERNTAAQQPATRDRKDVLHHPFFCCTPLQHDVAPQNPPSGDYEIDEKSPSAECGPECYPVVNPETGKPAKIHRPWAGCRKKVHTPAIRQIERTCWHCGGTKNCSCIACAEGSAVGASSECLVCHGSGKVAKWVQ